MALASKSYVLNPLNNDLDIRRGNFH